MELEPCLLHESRLLDIFEHAFAYFQLEDLAKVLSLSKRFMAAISQSPRLFILILKKYYMSQNHLHPKTRRYFKILLTRRPKIDVANLSGIAKEIYLLSEYRIQISKNLIRDVYCVKRRNEISERKQNFGFRARLNQNHFQNQNPSNALIEKTNGGQGWLLEETIIPEFRKGTLASSYGQCEIAYKAFFKQFSADFLQDFKNGRTVIKAGCFISRRADCDAHGGCILMIFDSDSKPVFEVKQHKTSEEIPTSWESDFAFTEIAFRVTSKDLPDHIDLEKCEMKLTIYGRDDRFWAGHYGSRFSAMYIRGDFAENPLEKILN